MAFIEWIARVDFGDSATRRVATGLVLLVLSVPTSAGAQASSELPTTSPFQAGPVKLYPALILQEVGMDYNVYGDAATVREDFTYTVLPRMRAALPVGRMLFVGSGSLGFVYYQTWKDQQSVTGEADGRFEVESGRVRPFADAMLARSRRRNESDVDMRARQTQTDASVGVDVQVSPITSLTAWARRSSLTYDEREQFQGVSLAQQLDHTNQFVAGGARFYVTPLTTLVVAAEFEQVRFASESVRDADSLRVAPAVEFEAGAIITGRAAAGYRVFNPLNPSVPRYRGLVGSARLGFTVLGMTRFTVDANRDVDFSYNVTQPYYLENRGRVEVAQRLAGPIELIATGERRRVEHRAMVGAAIDGQLHRVITLGAGVGIRMSEAMRLTLVYDRMERRSEGLSMPDYERRRLLGSVTYVP